MAKAIYSLTGKLLAEEGSDLQGSDLQGSDLQGSDLQGSDLQGSNLRGSNLQYSNLQYSDLRGSNFEDTILHSLGFSQRGYHFLLFLEEIPRITAGCRSFTIEEAENHWKDKPEYIKVQFAKMIIEQYKSSNHLKKGV